MPMYRRANSTMSLIFIAAPFDAPGGDPAFYLMARDPRRQRDRIEVNGIDRRLGGVHLTGGEPRWRWDESAYQLVMRRRLESAPPERGARSDVKPLFSLTSRRVGG